MCVLYGIFVVFLGAMGIVVCLRAGKLVVKAINRLFDKIEDKFC